MTQERARSGWLPHSCLPQLPALGRVSLPSLNLWSRRRALQKGPPPPDASGAHCSIMPCLPPLLKTAPVDNFMHGTAPALQARRLHLSWLMARRLHLSWLTARRHQVRLGGSRTAMNPRGNVHKCRMLLLLLHRIRLPRPCRPAHHPPSSSIQRSRHCHPPSRPSARGNSLKTSMVHTYDADSPGKLSSCHLGMQLTALVGYI
jgi:hypothetical protein